jgi:hypothetical protein
MNLEDHVSELNVYFSTSTTQLLQLIVLDVKLGFNVRKQPQLKQLFIVVLDPAAILSFFLRLGGRRLLLGRSQAQGTARGALGA